MKFPKLTKPILTMVISYLPIIFPFSIVCAYLILFTDGEMNLLRIFALIGSTVISLVFIIKNFGFYLFSDIILQQIHVWQKARQYFESDINSRDLKTTEKIISRRCKFFGREINSQVKNDNLILYRLSRRNSWTVNWSRIDKNFLVYSVSFLDEKIYGEIISSARANIKAEYKPFKPTIFTDKEQRKAPICKCSVVLILAENVSPYVFEKAVKCSENNYDGCFMPCVADLSTGRYYFDSLKETFMSAVPQKNKTISIIKQLVFGGKFPLKNNDKMLPCEIDSEFFEMTLWDLIKFYKKSVKEGEEETGKFINKMRTDEIKLDESLVFYKMEKKTAVMMFSEDEENEKKIEVTLDAEYEYPVKGKFTISEMNKIKKRITEELTKMGYEVSFNEEMLPKSYRK